ncbi:MAG: DMT family transporter [Nevskia sp.]|jgi:drug/metabolite transporter (DMT)-like permease|nr:DMT family transporter [Nevskia sp.]MCK9383868.1 DMT family transporter [Nevskia sp.]
MTFGLGEFFSVSCALVWAIAVVLFKKSGESLNPFALNLFKNGFAFTLMAITLALISPVPPAIPLPAVLLAMLSGYIGIGLADVFYLRALNAIGASRMAVAQTLFSPTVIALSTVFLGEHLRLGQWLGVVAVLGGITLVTYVRDLQLHALDAATLRRNGTLGVLSVMLMAVGVIIAKPLLSRYDFLWLVTIRLVGGLLGTGIYIAWRGNAAALYAEFKRVRHWPQIIAGSFAGTFLSTMLWLAGYKYTRASVAAVLNETAALFIVLLAVIFLGERLNRRQVSGIGLALAGVLMVVAG